MLTEEENNRREAILGIKGAPYDMGTEMFGGLSAERFERLVDNNFIALRDKPVYAKFLRFMKKYPMVFTAYGYCVHPDRQDTRVVISGLQSSYWSGKNYSYLAEEFKNTFSDADKLVADEKNNVYTCHYSHLTNGYQDKRYVAK